MNIIIFPPSPFNSQQIYNQEYLFSIVSIEAVFKLSKEFSRVKAVFSTYENLRNRFVNVTGFVNATCYFMWEKKNYGEQTTI